MVRSGPRDETLTDRDRPVSCLPTSRATVSLRFPPASSLFKTLSGGQPSVMNTTRNLIRSCSGSLTVQHLARRTVANSPRTQFLAVGSRRLYSEDAKPSGRKSEEESKDAGPSKDESESFKQLAVKEEEVADLKVCLFFRDRWHSVADICPRVGCGTSRRTLSTFNVTPRGKRSRRKTTPSPSSPRTCSRPRMCCRSLSNPFLPKRLNRLHLRHRCQHRKGNLPRDT